jgi:signal transduction histidine kinase
LARLQQADDLEGILDLSLRSIVEEMGFGLGLLALFEPGPLRVRCVSREGGWPADQERLDRVSRELERAGSFEEMLARQGPVGLEGTLLSLLGWDRGRAHIFPLLTKERPAGFIVLAEEDGRTPREEDRPILSVMLRQIAMELEREAAVKRQRRLAREGAFLLEAGRTITSGLDTVSILSRIVDASLEMVGVSRCLVVVLDRAGERPELFYSNTPDDFTVKDFFDRLSIVDDLLEGGRMVLREGLALVVEDCFDDPRVNRELARALNIRSLLGVPMLLHGQVIGAIQLDEPGRRHRFTPDDIRVMEGIADFAAVAIANARLYRESRDQKDRLGELMRRLAGAQEEERARISRELHDSMASTLLEIIYRAEALLGREEADEHLRGELQAMLQSSRSTLAELRRIITDLRPSSVEVLGLPRALATLLDRTAATYGLKMQRDIEEGLCLDSLLENSLYRLAQEALNNVCRHAAASRVEVSLRRRRGSLLLRVNDDGRGFDPAASPGGMGLIFMRERAELLGGSIRLESAPGQGTTLTLEVPLPGGDGGSKGA